MLVNGRVDAAAVFDAEWTLGDDGLYERESARVVLLDDTGRALLIRSHSDDGRAWWFTPGGGVDGQESHEAAARELHEETGIVVDADALIGPIWRRSAVFTFLGRRVRQRELFYLAVVSDPPAADDLTRDGWTDVELDGLDELRWFTPSELVGLTEDIYPAEFATLVADLDRSGWDGTLRDLGYAEDES